MTVRMNEQVNRWTSETVVRTKGIVTVTVSISGQVKLLKKRKKSVTVTVCMIGQVKLL